MPIANSPRPDSSPAAAAERLQSALIDLVARPESRGAERRQQHGSQVAQLLQAYRELMKLQAH